ncbi:MAG: FIST N-terminal domain-containing protein, partial [Pseudomonadota bacterium]
ERGYTEHEIVAVGLPRAHFAVETLLIDSLDAIDADATVGRLIRLRGALAAARRDWRPDFAFLLVDGLSLREDELVSVVAAGLGDTPLFGGSAGDGVAFDETMIALDGAIYTNAAVVVLARTRCPVKVFSLDHLTPTDRRMVVTKADSTRRIVSELNAEPAAREYARILGKDPNRLSPFTFAAHPLVVRVGAEHHVRAIQRVTEDDELVFFSAIDEGLVLTVSEPSDLAQNLEKSLSALNQGGRPDAILACDCILRRLEAEQKQMTRRVSSILAAHRAVGFSTYGEQFRAMHVNHTMTGVAFYRPEASKLRV